MKSLLRTLSVGAALFGAALAGGCESTDASGSAESNLSSCEDAYRDYGGYCRSSSTGRFMYPSCCEETECLFGFEVWQLEESSKVSVADERRLRTPAGLDALEAKQILAAVQSSYDEVTTLEEAFEAVDESKIFVADIQEKNGWRNYRMVHFGAGENDYGAVFPTGDTKIVALIQDGGFNACKPTAGSSAPTCGKLDEYARSVSCAIAPDALTCLAASEHGDAREFAATCCENAPDLAWCVADR